MVKNGGNITQVAKETGLQKNLIKRICDRHGVKSKYKFGGDKKLSVWERLARW